MDHCFHQQSILRENALHFTDTKTEAEYKDRNKSFFHMKELCHQYMKYMRFGITRGTVACYPRESEGLCFYRRWFVCLLVCYHDSSIKRGRIWTKFFGKFPRGKSKPKFVFGYDR